MPLPFEKWGSDRRKKDDRDGKDEGRKDKKKKSKMKSKEEEMLQRELNALRFQLVEERQNTRREKLHSARLVRELSDTRRNLAMKETLAQALYKKEQEQRVRAEQRLSSVLTNNEVYKSQLDHLRNTLTEQNATSEAGPNNNGEVELRDTKHKAVVELQQEKTLLLERLRIIESNNSALVIENEKQQHVYERCLDEVAAQVVQALLIQRELKGECSKLRNRVEELEIHNRQLRHLYEQEVWLKKQTHESCILENGAAPVEAPPGSFWHARHGPFGGSPTVFRHTYFSQTEMHHLPPYHLLYQGPFNDRDGPRVPGYPGAFHRQSSLPTSSNFSSCLPPVLVPDQVHFGPPGDTSQGSLLASCHKSLPPLPGDCSGQELFGGGECLGSGSNNLTNIRPSEHSGSMAVHPSDDTKGVVTVRKTQSLPATPLAHRNHQQNHLRNQTTFDFTENYNYLSDKYSKPYVHAPLDYAQGLLQELRELGASVKSFESLTLEPQAAINPPQKRKALLGDLESNPQPQKLVKGHGYLRSSHSGAVALENSDTFSLEDFPPDGANSLASGESIETAYERIIPSPEKSPESVHKVISPNKLVLEDNPALVNMQGDVLFDLEEQLLENENFSIDLPESFEEFSRGINSEEVGTDTESRKKQLHQTDEMREEGDLAVNEEDSRKAASDQKILSVSVEPKTKNVATASTNVVEGELIPLLPAAMSSPTTDDDAVGATGADYCRSIISTKDNNGGFEDLEVKRSDPQWKIDADKYEERPPTLPPRTHLVNMSFDSGSDDVFVVASVGAGAKRKVTPPELPPKPLWMRFGDIDLSTEDPPPIPVRKPLEPEGQECLSWKWRKSYDISENEGTAGESSKPLWEQAREKVKETDRELSNLLSSESDTEEEGLDYLAMWKAREKTPSWKECLDTNGAVSVKNISENQARLSAITRIDDHPGQKDRSSVVISRRESTEVKPTPDDLQTPKICARKESLIKKPSSEQKTEKKTKSSIPLFNRSSRKESSPSTKKGGSNGREKSMVKDFVSSIKAVMEGGRHGRSSNPLRKSSRSKSPKPAATSSGKKGNGRCSKDSLTENNQSRGDRDSPHSANRVSSSGDRMSGVKEKKKPPAASSKQSLIPKFKSQARNKSPRASSCSQSSELSSGQKSTKSESRSRGDRRSRSHSFGREPEVESKNRASKGNNCALNKSTSPGGPKAGDIHESPPAVLRGSRPVSRGPFLRVSSNGSINLEETVPSRAEKSVGVSMGSIENFHRVPFIDGNTPDQEVVDLSDQLSKLSGGPSPNHTRSSSQRSQVGCRTAGQDDTLGGIHPLHDNPGTTASHELRPGANSSMSAKFTPSSSFVDEREVDDIKKGKLVRDFDMANYNVLSSRMACTLPSMGKMMYSDPLLRSNVKSMSQGHTPPDVGAGKMTTQSDSVLQGAQCPDRLIQVPLVNSEIFDSCDESMEENRSLEHGGEHKAQLSEKERATLLDSLFDTDSDEDNDDGSCSQDASELASSDSHPEEREVMRLLDERGDAAKIHAVRQGPHNRVSLMQVDICSMFTRYGDKERKALSSFDFLEKVLSVQDETHPYLNQEMNGKTKRPDSGFAGYSSDSQPPMHLSDLTRPFTGDTHRTDGQLSPFAPNHEHTNTSMSSSLSTGSLSS